MSPATLHPARALRATSFILQHPLPSYATHVDSYLLGFILDRIHSAHDIDPFSWQFIFDEKFDKVRNAVVLGSNGRETLLSLILGTMDDAQRSRAFPHTFDLGNRHSAGDVTYSREDLANELDQESATGDATVVPGSFRTIESWILDITGRPFRDHIEQNSLKALKVLKLFYRVQQTRQSSFLRLIRPVRPGKGSMEHRDRYPLFTKGQNERQVWLLADVRSYLGSELTIARRRKIEAVFSDLLRRAEQRVNVDAAELLTRYGRDLEAWCEAYRRRIAAIHEHVDDNRHPIRRDLDESMYVYVHALPFMHFAAEYEQIVTTTVPDVSIASVEHEIAALRWVQRFSDGTESVSESLLIEEAASFYERARIDGVMAPIIAKATGYKVAASEYQLLAARSVELLSRYFTYRSDWPPFDQVRVTLRSCVVAMCAVWLETCKETEYRPYWMGQRRQGKRILEFLDQPFLQQGSPSGQRYPEAIDQIWALRFEWMADAALGRSEVGKLKALYKVAVLNEIALHIACLDIDSIERRIQDDFP